MLFYLISSSRRLWQDGQTNLTSGVGVVSSAAFLEEPPGPANDDTLHFGADVKFVVVTLIFFFLLQKALENASGSRYQVRM